MAMSKIACCNVNQKPADREKSILQRIYQFLKRDETMNLRKVTLIEPKSPGYHIYSHIALPRLGLPLLGAMLKKRGREVSIYCQEFSGLDMNSVLSSDLVGLSTTTSTAPEAYRIADKARAAGIPVMIGGSHVTFMADEALEHADYVVRGEGEFTMLELLDAIEAGDVPAGIRGLSYRNGDEVVHNPDRGLVSDLDALPFPDLSLIHGADKISLLPVATSRGCPFGCNFCSVTPMFGRGYRYRSTDNVIEELIQLTNSDVLCQQKVFFYDDNFAANRKHTKELLDTMLTKGVTPGWTAQVRVDVAQDRELLKLMKRSNCYYVYVGLESVNPESLEEFNKRQQVEQIVESIRILREHGIMVHGMFILGAEHDTLETIRDTVDFALRHKVDTVQLVPLTPLPGTPVFQNMEESDRLLTRDWSLYDGQHVVFRPQNMSPYELQKAMLLALKRFYSVYQCTKMLVNWDFVSFLYKLMMGRWRDARSQVRMRMHAWFYRTYGHIMSKRFEIANRGFTEKISRLADGAKGLAHHKHPTMEGLD